MTTYTFQTVDAEYETLDHVDGLVVYTFRFWNESFYVQAESDDEAMRIATCKLIMDHLIDPGQTFSWVCEDSYSPDILIFAEH